MLHGLAYASKLCLSNRAPVASVASGASPSYSLPSSKTHQVGEKKWMYIGIFTTWTTDILLLVFLYICKQIWTQCILLGYPFAMTESPAFDVFCGSVEFSSSELVRSVVPDGPDGWEVHAVEVSVDTVDKMLCIETVLVDETVRVLFVLDKLVVVDETVVQLVLLVELLVFVEVKVCVSVVIDTVELVLVKVVAVDDDTEVLLEVWVVSVDVVIVELLEDFVVLEVEVILLVLVLVVSVAVVDMVAVELLEDFVVLVVEVILLVLVLVVSVVVVDMVAVELLEDFVVLVVEVILLVLLLVVSVVVVDVVHVAVLVVPVVVSWQLPEKKGSVSLTVIFPT